VHQALTTLPEDDQRRLGVTADWKHGPHRLTYRQTERTFGLVADALAKDIPDGLPSQTLTAICDDLLEASIPDEFKDASTSLAVDWTDMETFSRPPPRGTSDCADPEASWGHRSGGGPGQDSELFFGYYASAGTMMREEHGPPVPELARRMTACSCRHDPARALVPVLTAMPAAGIALGDILSDSGYAHPATPGPGPSRCAAPGRSWSRTCTRSTAAPAAPTTAPSSPTGTCTARSRPGRCWNSRRWPATRPPNRPPNTICRPPSSPGTSSARSPPTTLTATTGSCAPPPWARSAARSARPP
jgi:hypothetical protein